jgi:hypothetical protein
MISLIWDPMDHIDIYTMSSAGDHVEKRKHSTEKHQRSTRADHSTMADNEKPEPETMQSISDNNDIHYATSFKLAAIMLTINLSTMVAALDLVRSLIDRNLRCR